MLKQRVGTALIAVPLLIAAVIVGEPVFPVLLGVIVVLGMLEFYRLAGSAGARPFRWTGIGLGLLFVLVAWTQWPVQIIVRSTPEVMTFDTLGRNVAFPFMVLAAIAVFVVVFRAVQRNETEGGLINIATTLTGVFYVGVAVSFFMLLRNQYSGPPLPVLFGIPVESGARWVLLVAFSVMAADIAAYAVGSLAGRTKLAPRISPGKSWEGLVAGVIACVIVSGVVSRWFEMPYSTLFGYLLGLPIAVLAVWGDLGESLIKRSVHAKDAGGLLPGHGGILDRLDSMTPPAVFIYFVSVWVLS
jgi:phosphatidate cytidylyltransferase